MALKDLDRDALEAKAVKLGVEYTRKTSDVRLRNRIRAALRQGKVGSKVKSRSSVVPKEWAPGMLATYYTQIVKRPMPSNEEKAYAHLMKVIDSSAETETVPRLSGKAPDCFGLFFSEKLDVCMHQCPDMPLCRRIVETRPELRKIADEIDEAADAVDKLSDEEIKDAKKVKTKKKKSKEKAQSKKTKRGEVEQKVVGTKKTYIMLGSLEDYDVDEGLQESYKWMVQRKSKGFTRSELVAKLEKAGYRDSLSLAKETIAWLLEEGDLKVKKSKR